MTQKTPDPVSPSDWADSLDDIRQRGRMEVTLFSGAKVVLRTVDLDELALEEALPLDLFMASTLDQADMLLPEIVQLLRNQKQDEALKLAAASADLRERVCRRAIVDPEPTPELLAALDAFDKRLIVEIAQRKTARDATGKAVAAESLADFARFREERDGVASGGEGGDGREVDAAVV